MAIEIVLIIVVKLTIIRTNTIMMLLAIIGVNAPFASIW